MTETSEKTDVLEYLSRCGYNWVIDAKEISGRRYAAIMPHSYGMVRIIVGSLDDRFSFDQQIEFDDLDAARRALASAGESDDGSGT